MIDIKKLELIPASDVPPRMGYGLWDSVFESVPEGMAFIIDKEKKDPHTVRSALKYCQKKGKFLNLIVRTRGDKAFIIHPSKE